MSQKRQNERKSLPDPTVCHTVHLKPVDLVECLVKSPEQCIYVIQIEDGFFCRHPDCHKFQHPPIS